MKTIVKQGLVASGQWLVFFGVYRNITLLPFLGQLYGERFRRVEFVMSNAGGITPCIGGMFSAFLMHALWACRQELRGERSHSWMTLVGKVRDI